MALLVIIALGVFSASAYAGTVSCNYVVSGDGQCNPKTGLYCVNYACQTVSDASTYCNDSDGNNLSASGTLNARYRDYSGAWLTASIGDNCLQGNTFASSCSGSNCFVREATCTTNGNYAFNSHPCSSCQNGACATQTVSSSTQTQPSSTQTPLTTAAKTGDGSATTSDAKTGTATTTTTSTTQTIDSKTSTVTTSPETTKTTTTSDATKTMTTVDTTKATTSTVSTDTTKVESLPAITPSLTSHTKTDLTTTSPTKITSDTNLDATTTGAKTAIDSNNTQKTTQIVVGKACDFSRYGDSQCDAANGFYCIRNSCVALSSQPKPFCSDAGDKNIFVAHDLNFSYRNPADGNFVNGSLSDYCLDANNLVEYYCSLQVTAGINHVSQKVKCVNGCSDGQCNFAPQQVVVQIPVTVSDEQLLSFISLWARARLGNEALLQIIEVWRNT